MNESKTTRGGTVQVLTPAGRGAVAVLAFQGDLKALQSRSIERRQPLFVSRSGFPLAELPVNRVLLGHWGAEELVVCRTAPDRLEIHCHGGSAAIERIVQDLQQCGVHQVDGSVSWATLNLQAFRQLAASSRREWLEQQYEIAVARAQTRQVARRIWLQQRAIAFWLELVERLDDSQPATVPGSGLQDQMQQSLQWSELGRHLVEPWRVVIGGRPNVGKSSLINALLGYQRAIVYDQPGTTRDVLMAVTALEGWPVFLHDTAGQREQAEPLEAAGIELARQTLAAADLAVLLFDGSQPPDSGDRVLLEQFPDALAVLSKADLPRAEGWKSLGGTFCDVSCRTAAGLAELQTQMVQRIVPALPDDSVILPLFPLQRELLNAVFHPDAC
jgi:tRNA modification GTPase